MNFYKRLPDNIAEACIYLEMLLLSLMIIMIFSLVVSRYIFSYSFAWVEALSRYMMIWMAYLGAAVLFKNNNHLAMDVLYRKMSKRSRWTFDLAFGIIQIAFLIMLVKLGIQYTQSVSFIVSPTLGISMFWPSVIIPISAVLMIFFILLNVISNILRLPGRSVED